jgi:hypothetical protein
VSGEDVSRAGGSGIKYRLFTLGLTRQPSSPAQLGPGDDGHHVRPCDGRNERLMQSHRHDPSCARIREGIMRPDGRSLERRASSCWRPEITPGVLHRALHLWLGRRFRICRQLHRLAESSGQRLQPQTPTFSRVSDRTLPATLP